MICVKNERINFTNCLFEGIDTQNIPVGISTLSNNLCDVFQVTKTLPVIYDKRPFSPHFSGLCL